MGLDGILLSVDGVKDASLICPFIHSQTLIDSSPFAPHFKGDPR